MAMGMRGDWDGGWMQLVTRNSYTGTATTDGCDSVEYADFSH